MVRRTVLFSPGDQPDLLRKAPNAGADVIVFDLEDAVAPTEKAAARETVTSVLGELDPGCELCVRINPLSEGGRADLDALVPDAAAVDSIMLPKVSASDDVTALADALEEHNLTLPVLALLETAGGVLDAPEIADVDAVDAVLLGAEDLAADIGATRTPGGTEISYARQRVVLAASRAGVDAIDTLHTDFQDTDGLVEDATSAVGMGFDGKMAIHPAQVSVINDAFTPSEEKIDWARRVLDARDEAERAGRGVFSVEGEMIDAPLIAQAEDVIERARAAGENI
jgi:citrate lyase subunit beta/citryl-CoA lyase